MCASSAERTSSPPRALTLLLSALTALLSLFDDRVTRPPRRSSLLCFPCPWQQCAARLPRRRRLGRRKRRARRRACSNRSCISLHAPVRRPPLYSSKYCSVKRVHRGRVRSSLENVSRHRRPRLVSTLCLGLCARCPFCRWAKPYEFHNYDVVLVRRRAQTRIGPGQYHARIDRGPVRKLIIRSARMQVWEFRTLVERWVALEALELRSTWLFLDEDPAGCATERCSLLLETRASTLRHLALFHTEMIVLGDSYDRIQRRSGAFDLRWLLLKSLSVLQSLPSGQGSH